MNAAAVLRTAWAWSRLLRVRLTILYVALMAVILAAFSVVLYFSLARALDAEVDRTLSDEARQATGVWRATREANSLAEEFRRLNVGTIVGLYDADGSTLLAGRAAPGGQEPLGPMSPGEQRSERIALPDGSEWRTLAIALDEPGLPGRILLVARSERGTQLALGQLLALIGVTIPLALVAAVAAGVFLVGRALDPIDRITRTVDEITADDLSRRLNLRSNNDELSRLGATFDRMLGRLEDAFQRQLRFTADASHELRTPLTMLITRAGLALERRRSPAEYEEALRCVRDEAKHMARVVGDLLLLARADANQVLAERETLDLNELVSGIVSELQPVAGSRGLELACDSSSAQVLVDGDQTRLVQLVLNLVENAFAYTPAGGSVRIEVSRMGTDWAILRVRDTGVGIASEHLPHIFDRFYRADEARSRSDGGAGLGLSLCQWIARAHGGDVSVASVPGEGTTFSVRLPSRPAHTEGRPAPRGVAHGRSRGRLPERRTRPEPRARATAR